MKKLKLYLLVAVCTSFVTKNFAQVRNYDIINTVGISGGLTQFNLNTDNFNTTAGTGWFVKGTSIADFPKRIYNLSYNIQLSQNKLSIAGREAIGLESNAVDINYKILAAQVSMLFHLKPINMLDYFTLDIGPMLQYNGKLTLEDDAQDTIFIHNYQDLQAKDIEDINNFNANITAGASVGVKRFKLTAHYVYGFLNSIDKLNDNNFSNSVNSSTFKANQSMWLFGASFYF